MKSVNRKILVAGVGAWTCLGAQAADKAPTLADVLKASDIAITGYIDTSYTHLSGLGTFTGGTPNRVFDRERRSFNLHTADVSIAYQPATGFGGFVQVSMGSDADVFGAIGTNTTDNVDLQEAYIQYASGSLTLMGGKFVTISGAEVIESPSNLNFSRSILFGYAIPFTHTGVRATIAPNDKLKLIAGVNNGWDVLKESAAGNIAGDGRVADSKTIELGASATPIKALTLSAALYSGDEASAANTVGTRDLLDLVATLNLSDALSFTLNYDTATQDKALAGGGDAKWNGLAGYVNYKLNDLWRVAFRAEHFDDKNGFRTGVVQKWKEVTATLAYTPTKNVELRAEVRDDKSNVSSFVEKGGGTKKNQNSFGLEAIYKF